MQLHSNAVDFFFAIINTHRYGNLYILIMREDKFETWFQILFDYRLF